MAGLREVRTFMSRKRPSSKDLQVLPKSQNDMGFLIKVLTAAPLPTMESDFQDLMAIWFPRLYDVKYIMKNTRPIKVGLQELADEFQVRYKHWLIQNGRAHSRSCCMAGLATRVSTSSGLRLARHRWCILQDQERVLRW